MPPRRGDRDGAGVARGFGRATSSPPTTVLKLSRSPHCDKMICAALRLAPVKTAVGSLSRICMAACAIPRYGSTLRRVAAAGEADGSRSPPAARSVFRNNRIAVEAGP